jgi:ATP-dependent helicase/nuclease subunit A
LWPLAPVPEVVAAGNWTIPAENQGLVSAPQLLADGIAGAVAGMLSRGERLPSKDRALEAGDVLVLVRRRGAFATALVRALKARGVPVAGLDRLKLTEQVAVQDLLVACEAVLLPDDQLSVACVLTSPLGGLSDESLMDLSLRRSGSLWDTLRERAGERADWAQAWRFLSTLAERADYVTPHALLTEALGALGGRARLLARLGAEAAEPIDEMLNAALSYTRLYAPSLQGFVHWMRRSGAEVKREAGGAGSVVRVMTAHGAKGLQAPVVIVPDTTGLPPERESLAWCRVGDAEVPLWAPRSELRCGAWQAAADAAKALRMREYNRLLYVALTRAEDRLVVCGWRAKRGDPAETSWYEMVRRGFGLMGAAALPFVGPWEGEMLVASSAQTDVVRTTMSVTPARAAPLPAWAGRPGQWQPAPPPAEPALPRPLAPSRPSGAMFGPVPAGMSPLLAQGGPRFGRGTAVHTLLQHLPTMPEAARPAAAAAWLAQGGLAAEEQHALTEQVLAVLSLPELAPLFGRAGRAEQPLSGLVDGQVITGVVDRMAVLADAIVIADFKTGRAAPADVMDTPVRYVRQLAAYRAVLQGLFAGRAVRCWLVWTEGAVAAMLPDALLDRFAPGSGAALRPSCIG